MGHSSARGFRWPEWGHGVALIGLRGSGVSCSQVVAVGGHTLRGVSGVVCNDKASAVEAVVAGNNVGDCGGNGDTGGVARAVVAELEADGCIVSVGGSAAGAGTTT
jgi:hypothetical protein